MRKNSRTSTVATRRGAVAVAAAGAGVVGLLALPGTASANGGVAQGVDVVLSLPSFTTPSSLPGSVCLDPDGAGPEHKETCQPIGGATTPGDDFALALDYVLSSSTQPSAVLTRAGEGVCPGSTTGYGMVLELGPATYQPNSWIVVTLARNGGTPQEVFKYPAGSGSTRYLPVAKVC